MPEGRQSPPPEQQDAKQGREPTANAKGVNEGAETKKDAQGALDDLESNPKGPLDDAAAAKVSKTVENNA